MTDSSLTKADAREARLARLLGFLDADRGNALLINDALALAIDLRRMDAAETIAGMAAALPACPPSLAANLCLFFLYEGKPDLALTAGRQALAAPSVPNNLNTALAAFRCAEYAETVRLIEQVFPEPSQCPPDANLLCARALHHLGETERALARLNQPADTLELKSQQMAEYLGVRALIAVDNGDAEDAVADARTALQLDDQQGDALLALAEALKDLGEYGQARDVYQTLSAIRPQMGRAWSGLAQVHLASMSLAEAEDCALRATKHMTDHIGTWHVLGWTKLIRGDLPGARIAFDASLPLERGFADTHGALAAVEFMEGNNNEGERRLKVAERLDAASAAVQFARFLKLLAAKDSDAARAFFEATLDSKAPGSNATLRSLVEARARSLLSNSTAH